KGNRPSFVTRLANQIDGYIHLAVFLTEFLSQFSSPFANAVAGLLIERIPGDKALDDGIAVCGNLGRNGDLFDGRHALIFLGKRERVKTEWAFRTGACFRGALAKTGS